MVMKKAFLVDVVLRTRVVVDVPENWDRNDDVLDNISQVACDRLTGFVLNGDNPICIDNVDNIVEDIEMPVDDTDESAELVTMTDAFRKEIVSLLLNGKEQNETRKEYYVDDIETKLCVKEYSIAGENDILVDAHSIVIENVNGTYNVVLVYKEYDMLFVVDTSDVSIISLYNLVRELRSKAGL